MSPAGHHLAELNVGRLLAPTGTVVLEHSRRRDTPLEVGGLTRRRVVAAGDRALSLYTFTQAV